MEVGEFNTYVWSPLHSNHSFEKAGVYPTYLGILYVWKCSKCGDVQMKVEKKSAYQRINVSTISISIEKK